MSHLTKLVALFLAFVVCAFVFAAPVPKSDVKLTDAQTKEMDGLWMKLGKSGTDAVEATLALAKQPAEATLYLKPKLRPLKLEEKEAKQLIARLFSEKEEEWKEAERELHHRPPILAMKLPDIWAEAKTPEHKARLAIVLCMLKRNNADSEFELVEQPGDAAHPFKMQCKYTVLLGNLPPGTKATDTCPVPEVVSKLNDHGDWHRLQRAIHILEHIGTPDAMKVIEEMASGHADASPTKTAKEALERLKKK
jgi:hypothetical protein